jgi:DNA polymerase-1
MNRFIIDGFNLVYRAHYAFINFFTTTGIHSGGFYGVYATLRSLRKKYPNFRFYVVWDNEALKKKEVFFDYKANRNGNRVNLPISDLKVSFKCLNITQVECPGEEADDVIASLVNQNTLDGKDYIYSSDKDLLQLVKNGQVIVISPKVGNIPERCYDEGAVKDKWGVSPEDLPCLLAFKGDTSDNIPGVPRVPLKVLSELSSKYKRPSEIYIKLYDESLTDFQFKSIIDFKSQIMLNYSLVLLNKKLPLVLREGVSNLELLTSLFNKYEIKSFSPEEIIELFSADTVFLNRESPSLKTISMFEEGE